MLHNDLEAGGSVGKIRRLFSSPFALFFLVGVLIYSNSLYNGFVFDDAHTVLENSFIRSFRHIPLFFKGMYSSLPHTPSMFRPLLMLTFSLNYFCHHLWLPGYHIFNIFIHVLNTYLIYLILLLLFPDLAKGIKIVVSLIFLTHPINVEAVSYITSRSDLLVLTFSLLCFYNYIIWEQKKVKRRLIYSYFSLVLAFLTKESAIAIAVFFLFYFWQRYGDKVKKEIKYFFPYAGISILYLILRKILYHQVISSYSIREYWLNILTQAKVSFFYLRLFIFPYPLSIDHQNLAVTNPTDIMGVISLILILLFWVTIFLNRRKKFFLLKISLLWYFSFLLPKFVAKLNFVAMEHHFYLPSLGMYILLCCMFERLKRKELAKYITVFIVVVFSLLTFIRNFDWKNRTTVWEKTLKKASIYGLEEVGYSYLSKGRYDKALIYLNRALDLSRDGSHSIKILTAIAGAYRGKGELDRAKRLLLAVLKLNIASAKILHELGLIYKAEHNFEKAKYYWKLEAKKSPYYDGVYFNLGLVYYLEKDYPAAKKYLIEAVKYNPTLSRAYFILGTIAEKEAETRKAIYYYRKAVKYSPEHLLANYNLGTIYALEGDKKAIKYFKKAIKICPGFSLAYYNLGLFYLSAGDSYKTKAMEMLKKAEELGYKIPSGINKLTKNAVVK